MKKFARRNNVQLNNDLMARIRRASLESTSASVLKGWRNQLIALQQQGVPCQGYLKDVVEELRARR